MSVVDALLSPKKPEPPATPLPGPETRARLRKAQGLTQAEVGAAFKVKAVTVSSWENGRSEPQGNTRELYAELLRRIAERLGEPITWEGTDNDSDE